LPQVFAHEWFNETMAVINLALEPFLPAA